MRNPFSLLLLSLALSGCGALGDIVDQLDKEDDEEETGACTDLVNGGDAIPETAGFVFFGPMGGEIADGTYHLTKFDVFAPGSVDPKSRRHTLRVTGDRVEVVTQTVGEPELRRTATMATEGSKITFTVDCPAPEVFSFSYTASPELFTHIIEGEGIKEVHTFTRQ